MDEQDKENPLIIFEIIYNYKRTNYQDMFNYL